MAVVAKWMCDRDNTMFDTKKEADAYDKMLELAEQFTSLIELHIPDVDGVKAEEFGILLAKHKDLVAQACKGSPEVLMKVGQAEGDNVTQLKSGAS